MHPPWLTHSVIARLSCQPGEAVGLPGEAYTEEAGFAVERIRVLTRTWVCVALEADVAEPGDLFPTTIAGIDLLLSRDRNRAIHAFHNVCVHRGAQLVDAPQTGRALIVCPYHAWAYHLGGDLLRTPHIGGPDVHACPEFAAGGIALSRVRVASWAGLVFANLDGKAPALNEHLAPLQRHLSGYDFGALRHGGGVSFDLRANWKLGVENFLERYHLPFVHPALNAYSSFDSTFLIFGHKLYVGSGSNSYTAPDVSGPPLPRISGPAGQDASRAQYLSVFPNLLIGLHADHFYAFIMLPQAAGRTTERFEFFFVNEGATAPEHAESRAALMERRRVTNLEDIAIVERMQRGCASPGFRGARFSPFFETTTLEFQRSWLAALLAPTVPDATSKDHHGQT
jgi:choline monooxygenase